MYLEDGVGPVQEGNKQWWKQMEENCFFRYSKGTKVMLCNSRSGLDSLPRRITWMRANGSKYPCLQTHFKAGKVLVLFNSGKDATSLNH